MAIDFAAGGLVTEAVDLDDVRALDPAIVGPKAANLASSRRAGLPVLHGFVVPVDVAATAAAGAALPATVLAAYRGLSTDAQRPVIVRSSSPQEDTATSSQAGRFTSVVDVRGVAAFRDAVRLVAASGDGAPMAVLVQPHLDPVVAGVAFGLDPVTGRTDHVVVAAVAGGPQRLVAGEVAGDRYELGRRGRLRSYDQGDGGTALDRVLRRRITSLVRTAAAVHGGHQDVEWAATSAGEVVLLQTRPVTVQVKPASGPRYGPGPLAETFPAPLAALEQELWLRPLRAAVAEVVVLTGRARRRHVASRAMVVSPGGRPALDLELLEGGRTPGRLRFLDPRPKVLRLAAAWRVGRLAAAIDDVADDVVAACDAALAAVPELDDLSDRELLDVLDRAAAALTSLHGHELLVGALRPDGDGGATGAEVALHALWRARVDGLSSAETIARHPEVLALTSPRIGEPVPLPTDAPALRSIGIEHLGPREALRLRIRWVHELTVRAARELGRRLALRGVLHDAEEVRHLDRTALAAALAGEHVDVVATLPGPPLPAAFRLTVDGSVVAVAGPGGGAGVGAGGGRGAGPVHHGDEPPPGSVLVVPVLEPGLAPWLPRLAGLVSETGSPLSHLAILAREHGVPTVVAVAGALDRWAAGQVLLVDGATGEVVTLDPGAVAG